MAGGPLSAGLGRLAGNCINRAQRGGGLFPETGKTVTHVVNHK